MEEIRREIGAIITEMNQTTERNIELIEDRIGRLKKLIEAADKRVVVMRREAERRDRAEETYSRLGRTLQVLPESPPATDSRRSDPVPDTDPREPLPVEEGVIPGRPPVSPDTEDDSEGSPDGDPASLRRRVLGLYRLGIPIERIASRVGTTVSEIELIVSLGDRQ